MTQRGPTYDFKPSGGGYFISFCEPVVVEERCMIIMITTQDVEKRGGDSMSVYVAEMSSRVGCNYYE